MVIKTIRGLLGSRPVVSVAPDVTLEATVDVFAQHEISGVVVLDSGHLKGIVTERDIIRHVSQFGGLETTQVADVMTREVKHVETRSSIVEAVEIMQTGGFRHLPVLDMGQVVIGTLFLTDIPAEYRDMHERYARQRLPGVAA